MSLTNREVEALATRSLELVSGMPLDIWICRQQNKTYQTFKNSAVPSFEWIKILELLILFVNDCQTPMYLLVNRDKYLSKIEKIRIWQLTVNKNKCSEKWKGFALFYFVTVNQEISQLFFCGPSFDSSIIIATLTSTC
jgi:hypothetical protein